ncbi:PHD finger protein 14, partial [Armadillidium vulgare]
MAEENLPKNDTVGLFLRAMVDREPGKRKVKPSKSALIDLAELDLGESSDDSDFNCPDDDEDDDDDEEDENDEEDSTDQETVTNSTSATVQSNSKSNVTIGELLARAEEKQALAAEQGIIRPKILVCAICLGEYSDDANEIVTCDGCHVSVHEGCYGISDTISVSSTVSSSSTEPWFCDACKAGVSDPPCELCPNLGYTIFKETEMGRWVHLVCALYVLVWHLVGKYVVCICVYFILCGLHLCLLYSMWSTFALAL